MRVQHTNVVESIQLFLIFETSNSIVKVVKSPSRMNNTIIEEFTKVTNYCFIPSPATGDDQ